MTAADALAVAAEPSITLPAVSVQAVDDIDDVIEALDAVVDQAITTESRVGYFASLYRQVTVAVKQRIDEGWFDDAERMSRFDAAFAARYLEAHALWTSGAAPAKSWEIAFDVAARDDRVVIQHLLLGINAHVNLDLGIAAARVGGDGHGGGDIFELEADFLRINDVFGGVLNQVQNVLDDLSPLMKILDDVGGRTDEEIVHFNVRKAREEAWNHAVVLARQDAAEEARTIDVLDRKVAFLARILDDPGPLLRPALELIRFIETKDVVRVIEALNAPVVVTLPR